MSFKEYPKKNLNVYLWVLRLLLILDTILDMIVEKFVPIVAEIKGLK